MKRIAHAILLCLALGLVGSAVQAQTPKIDHYPGPSAGDSGLKEAAVAVEKLAGAIREPGKLVLKLELDTMFAVVAAVCVFPFVLWVLRPQRAAAGA